MTDLLSMYEKDFRKNQDSINKNIEKIYDYLSATSIKEYNVNDIMQQLENLIDYQKKLISQIEVEVSSSSSIKKEDIEGYNSKIFSYKQNYEMNKKKYRELEEKINLKEASLILTDQNQLKGNLIKNEQLAYNGTLKIQQMKRALAEAEDSGNKILVDMDKQTNIMKNTNNKLKGMNSELDESNTILNKMKSRIKKNKNIIKYFGLILLVIVIIILIYKVWKFLKGKEKKK